MNKNTLVYGILGLLLISSAAVYGPRFISKNNSSIDKINPTPAQLTQIRIGWQIPWATQGQLTQVLKHTQLLQENGLVGKFSGFVAGPPLNEAAMAKAVDVIFTADQPAATLLSKNPNWVIIGRLMYNRVSLYVPPNSPIKTVADLKGKTVGMPFGAAAQRMALKAEEDAGLTPGTDVTNVNLGIYEQSDLVKDPKATKWGTMDALAGFDPSPALFEDKGLVRNLHVGKVVSLIVISREYIVKNPNAPVQFLTAFNEAYKYYKNNITQSDAWFIEESKLKLSSKPLAIASGMEPNLSVKTDADIRIGFIEGDYKIMQDAADFLFKQGLIKKEITMKDHVDLSFLKKAQLK